MTLRPEGTAPIVRSLLSINCSAQSMRNRSKLLYGTNVSLRTPSKGRLRQFHQIGVEAFGSENPATDVESMVMALDFFKQLGITQIRLVINSLGDKETRQAYRQALIDYLYLLNQS